MKKLTDRQREAVKIIYDGQKMGKIPTFFELAEKMGVSSKQTAKNILDAIAKKGYLEREPRRARAIILKQIAINEIEQEKSFFGKVQLNLEFSFPQTSHSFQWSNPSNIIIHQGDVSNFEKNLIDSSSLINLLNQNGTTPNDFNPNIQFIAEKSNFDKLYNSTGKLFVEQCNYLVVSPIMPSVGIQGGYVIPDKNSTYKIVWSGANSNNYFQFGKEYGSTSYISFSENDNQQMKLFHSSLSTSEVFGLISEFKKQIRSWSQYVDFSISGGALKGTGEMLFWSKKTDRDINDLRYFFLVDITKTTFQSSDKTLMRDVLYNFPQLIINSTK
ncbi:MAG: hypothetical protein ABII94_04175 [Patescibacteria group bacterium]